MVSGAHINEWIYQIVQAPLEAIFQSPAGIIAIVVISQLFWFLGIHGGLVISPIRNPLMAAAIAANVAAVGAGQVATQPVTYGFWLNFVVTGGAGITLSLIFAIFLFSKREDHRMIAKLSFLPGLCGISAVSYTHLDVYKRQLQARQPDVPGHENQQQLDSHGADQQAF